MYERFMIDHLATQRVDDNGITYNFRDMEQVKGYVKGLSSGVNGRKPMYEYWFATDDNTGESFVDSINYISDIYSKNNGIRLRGVIVEVSKLNVEEISNEKIILIAQEYAQYYLYQGYITGVVVYDLGSIYRIYYFINPVSYWDGSKYRPNYQAFLSNEYQTFDYVMDDILYGQCRCDYSGLVAYPLI